MHPMDKPPASVSATRVLIYLNALIWLAFALIVAFGLHPALPEGALFKWVMVILALAAGLGLLGVYALLRRYGGVAYYLMLASLAFIALLTVTDDFGVSDLLVLIVNVAAIFLLIKDRAFYLRPDRASRQQG
jgi:hypothetical protein